MKYIPQGNPRNTYHFGNARFTFFTERFLRIEWDPEKNFTDEPTFAAVHRYCDDVTVEKTEKGATICLKTAQIELNYQDQAGPLNRNMLSIAFKNGERTDTWHFGDTDPENLGGTVRTLDGMKGDKLHIRGAEREVVGWKDNPPDNGLISRSGYAVFDDSDNVCFQQHEGHFSTWPAARTEGSTDLYFMAYGHDHKAAVKDASLVFGKIPLPPRYALGYWYSRYFPFTDHDIRDLVTTTRTLEMPMDVMVIDMEWHQPGWTGYTWDRSYFPAPEKLLEWLHNQNIKTTLNLHPAAGIAAHEECYPAFAKAMGINPESKETIPFDATNPQFMENYFKILHNPLEEEGVDFWWMDWQQGKTCSIRNLDPLMMLNKLHYEDLERTRPEQRPLNFSRYSGLGSGRYPIGFSGDTYICWESLAYQPGLTAGSANILYGYWSHDIGGHYRGELTPELFSRWIQLGLYSPILRVHSGADRRLWEQASPYRWMMIEQVRRRYELIPYIYSEMYRGHETGLALCYPLYYDFPDKENAYQNKSQYMFGEKMLCAPITTKADPESGLATQKVWLPEGRWIDTAHGTTVEGNQTYAAEYTLDQIPVFVKTGTLIPGLDGAQHLDFSSYENLHLTCHRGGTGSYRLYEDDGSSPSYIDEKRVTLDISQQQDGESREIILEARSGDYPGYQARKEIKLSLPLTPYPTAVTLNGHPLDLSAAAEYKAATLTSIISAGVLDLDQKNTLRVEFPPHDPGLFDGIPGELAKLLTLKEDIRGLGRGGKVLLDVNEDRFYFDLIGIIERISYYPETVLSELEAFKKKKARALRLCDKYLKVAHAVLAYTQTEAEPEKVREKFPTICFNRTVQNVIDWSNNAAGALPKLEEMLKSFETEKPA
ncbi:glycoside hydrolase family 31 protein [Kiritimatiellaeota bacterium B1221]|nr:glycoside hydrolase family 31 protein [Kiritimatiellaeota bacterium B1221]